MQQPDPKLLRFDFVPNKYGDELLVDVGSTSELPAFEFHRRPHQLMFYDVLLLRAGHGRLLQEQRWHPVGPGAVVFHRPGERRRWMLSDEAEGIVLFFTAEFLLSFLADRHFVSNLPFFAPQGPRVLPLSPHDATAFNVRLESMREEVVARSWGHRLALQAATFEALVWLARITHQQFGAQSLPAHPDWYQRFEHAVETDFREHRRVAHYARACGVSASHLNALVREHSGSSVGEFVRARVLLEARRSLLYGSQSVGEIAQACGFSDVSYFCRFFRRYVGQSPLTYRKQSRWTRGEKGFVAKALL